jgi:hypothetical protein
MRKARKVTATLGALAIASVGFASGAQANNGFDEITSPPTQGNSGKPAKDNGNQGTQTTTTIGPHGQVKQGKDANTTTTTTGPGQSQHN